MHKTLINPVSLGVPRGYSNGVLTHGGRLLFLAAQTGTDVVGKIANPFDLIDQFQRTLENIQAILNQAGGALTDIVKLTIFITDKRAYHAQRERVGEVYRAYFGEYLPALTLVEIKSLYDANAMIQIEGIAVLPDS